MAVNINIIVAVMDRHEKRAIPQTECPLVHPLPIRVPRPTRKPPIMITGKEAFNSKTNDR